MAIADGIIALKSFVNRKVLRSFLSIATGSDGAADAPNATDDSASWRLCPGCSGRMGKHDPKHNRIQGICNYPNVEPITYGCRGCANRLHDGHASHNYLPDECKFFNQSGRTSKARSGRHPKERACKTRNRRRRW